MDLPKNIKVLVKTVCLMGLLLCFGSFAQTITSQHQIHLKQGHFKLVTEGYFSKKLNFDTLPEDQQIYLTYWGASPTAELIYGVHSLPIFYRGNDTESVLLKLDNKTKRIVFNIQGKPAQFDHRYIQLHSGKVTAQIPEVYELTNIVLAIADKFYQTNYGGYAQGAYHQAMLKWFTPFKDHRLFNALKGGDYYSLIDNGPAYEFVDNEIKPSTVYNGFRAEDAIKKHLSLLEDFAKTSQFRAFYQQHKAYYLSLTKQFISDTKPQQIWRWLESEFPARYQSYQVFFSPLGAGRHSARMYTDNNFKQAIMFISGPNRYKNASDTASIQAIKLARTFFTEIDHAYVNPVSDNFIGQITAALPDLSTWYKGGSYNNPYSTFNEYMTWSVFLLYANEHDPVQAYLVIKAYVEKFMQTRRGFYKFAAFHQELTRLYKNRLEGQRIVDLYAPIISWVKSN